MLTTNASLPRPASTANRPAVTPARFTVLLLLILLALFPSVILGTGTFFYRDYGVLAYPTLAYAHDSFWRGSIPFWNPYSNCGAPFLAQWGTMVLYPFALFYWVLPLPWAANVFCLAHLVWAGLGMFVLARRWTREPWAASVAGLTFVFNGVTLSCLMWPNYCVALGWMPWVVLLGERAWKAASPRSWVLAAVVATCQLLAGVPELVILTWAILCGLWILELLRRPAARRKLLTAGVVVVLLTAGLAAAQLLPFFELLAHSQRDATAATGKWALPWSGWGDFLLPLFRCAESPQGMFFQLGQDFFASNYLGIVPLILALAAVWSVRDRRVWLLAGLSVLCLCLTRGEDGLVYRALRAILPGVGFVRYPVKFVLLPAFAVPLLASYALRNWTTHLNQTDLGVVLWRRVLILGSAAALGLVVLLGITWTHPSRYEQWPVVWHSAAWRGLFLLTALALLRAGQTRQTATHANFAAFGLFAVLVADACVAVPDKNPVLPSSVLTRGLWQAQHPGAEVELGLNRVFIQPAAEDQLLVSHVRNLEADFLGKRLALWSHLNLIDRISKVNGSSTLQIREEKQLESILYNRTNTDLSGLRRFLSVSFQTAPNQVVEWTPSSNALPWITIGQQPLFASPQETRQALSTARFAPAIQVYLPLEARERVQASASPRARVEAARVRPQSIEFTTDSPVQTMAVIGQSFYPVWRAAVDGQPARLWRANHAFQALEVPAGKHQVRLVYWDGRFWFGLAVSGLSLAVCLALWFRGIGHSESLAEAKEG